ncbi:hypothetical protein JG687_00017293, partial [Phytophthora cactorum]
ANPALAVTVCWTRSNNVFLASFFGGHAHLYRILFVLRGETDIDSRPNKALEIRSHRPEWASYQYKSEWEKVVRYGFIPEWKTNFAREVSPPLNHSSTSTAMKSILRSIRKGQDKNQYLVLDLDLLDILIAVHLEQHGRGLQLWLKMLG